MTHSYSIIRNLAASYYYYRKEKRYAKSCKIPIFNKTFNFQKKRNKLFILGCGSSINDLKDENWDEISRETSIGINMFYINEFEPDFLMIEGTRSNKDRNYDWRNESLVKYLNMNKNTNILIKEMMSMQLDYNSLKETAGNRLYSIPRLNVPARSFSEYTKSLIYLKRMGTFKNIPFYSRSSVILAISIGIVFGFKEIILCGTDLLNSKYFWNSKEFYRQHKSILQLPVKPKINTDAPHKLTKNINGELSQPDIIEIIQEQILNSYDISLTIATKKSLLYPKLQLTRSLTF